LLVPIREAGALVPQLFTAGFLRRLPRRKWAWAAGAGVQGLSALAMGLAALTLEGRALGVAILGALMTLALARSVCSVTYKDVLGKTVSKSRRGSATGAASSVAAAAVLGFGALLASGVIDRLTLVTWALFLAGAAWLCGAILFAGMKEAAGATEGGANALDETLKNFRLLKEDAQLRCFILTRGLLISTALAPPFMVALAYADSDQTAQSAFGGLGLLVIASALAALLSSYVWGRLSDRSSRKVLIFSAGTAVVALLATLALNALGLIAEVWALPVVLFGLMIAYQGIRLGRSTHLVDMATEETRAAYTALSNTAIGVLLIAGGGFSIVASLAGEAAVLGIMAAMSAAAIFAALSLREVQAA
jgi:hypothetical protein